MPESAIKSIFIRDSASIRIVEAERKRKGGRSAADTLRRIIREWREYHALDDSQVTHKRIRG